MIFSKFSKVQEELEILELEVKLLKLLRIKKIRQIIIIIIKKYRFTGKECASSNRSIALYDRILKGCSSRFCPACS